MVKGQAELIAEELDGFFRIIRIGEQCLTMENLLDTGCLPTPLDPAGHHRFHFLEPLRILSLQAVIIVVLVSPWDQLGQGSGAVVRQRKLFHVINLLREGLA